MMPLFIGMSFVMALVKIFALATIRKQRWLTREVEVSAKSKQVVRTGAASSAPAGVAGVQTPGRTGVAA